MTEIEKKPNLPSHLLPLLEVISNKKNFTGHWIDIHLSSLKRPEFCLQYLGFKAETLTCKVCRAHFATYIDTNLPPSPSETITIDGKSIPKLFEYGVNFHNAVNRRTGKPSYTVYDMYILYDSILDVCSESCKDSVTPSSPSTHTTHVPSKEIEKVIGKKVHVDNIGYYKIPVWNPPH